MRLWSFHCKYLDQVGLNRVINEGISGYKALTGQQEMWKNHPQLDRFKAFDTFKKECLKDYLKGIIYYKFNQLSIIFDEILLIYKPKFELTVTTGQLQYEWKHYLNKLKTQKGRDKKLYEQLKDIEMPEPHPIFKVVDGDIEKWEKVKQ